MNPLIFYVVGITPSGNPVRRVISDVASADHARRLFTAMTSCEVLHCCRATEQVLVMHIRDLEVDCHHRINMAINETLNNFVASRPSKPGRKKKAKP